MSGLSNAVSVDDDEEAVKERCVAGGVNFTLITSIREGSAIVICRSEEDASRLLALYGLRAHAQVRDDSC